MQSRMGSLTMLLLAALLVCVFAAADRLAFKSDGTFKIIHVSDTHYELGPATSCRDVDPNLPCSLANTTNFINRLIELEKPDLVVYTGDIIDSSTHPSEKGMDTLYGLSIAHSLPWAASLGNHDDNSNLNRSQVMSYIVGMQDTVAQIGPVAQLHSYGNYYLPIYPNSAAQDPAFRFYFLDSDTNTESENPYQVAWFTELSRSLNEAVRTAALMFFHIPLEEYATAILSGNHTGQCNEQVSYQPVNSGLFAAIAAAGDVVATFCGHDHTNDFCAKYYGVHLCYEGSPGYQAYGKLGFTRRARVTEVRAFGQEVVTWKRLDDAQGTIIDLETLWSKQAKMADAPAQQYPLSEDEYATLPRRSQHGHPK